MNGFTDFQQTVWNYYRANGRHDLPWRLAGARGKFDPYKIMVSEIMLQQTQVPRVIPKFRQFVGMFPNTSILSVASLGEVISSWSGLGYNRRAKFLWQAAGIITHDYNGQVPASRSELAKLPGIGPNTAGAILAYAYDQPEVFIETNIRTAFIHHFFAGQQDVADSAIAGLVSATLPRQTPREWYWALMDYGTHLKQTVGNLARQARGFTKQPRFEGSRRQIRGKILRLLALRPHSKTQLHATITDERLAGVLEQLIAEGLIIHAGRTYALPGV